MVITDDMLEEIGIRIESARKTTGVGSFENTLWLRNLGRAAVEAVAPVVLNYPGGDSTDFKAAGISSDGWGIVARFLHQRLKDVTPKPDPAVVGLQRWFLEHGLTSMANDLKAIESIVKVFRNTESQSVAGKVAHDPDAEIGRAIGRAPRPQEIRK